MARLGISVWSGVTLVQGAVHAEVQGEVCVMVRSLVQGKVHGIATSEFRHAGRLSYAYLRESSMWERVASVSQGVCSIGRRRRHFPGARVSTKGESGVLSGGGDIIAVPGGRAQWFARRTGDPRHASSVKFDGRFSHRNVWGIWYRNTAHGVTSRSARLAGSVPMFVVT
ncbi:hypothetical protein GGX14DRAFT_398176 [Mycena pura]|uniref:Uncharacterized protein n=1 Tax=Mycena pura TaxID=153505 RepID=A0AAD6Y7W1_9AGAR|nr:hypothetical protein GGX14DRAFT_398176 [Mycena pura]